MKNKEEIYQALLDGKVLIENAGLRARLIRGCLVDADDHNRELDTGFWFPKDWQIEKPKRETIMLYETYDRYGSRRLCCENGKWIDFDVCKLITDSNLNCAIRKKNIIAGSMFEVYADNFERVSNA